MKMPLLTHFESMMKHVRQLIVVLLFVGAGRGSAAEEGWHLARGPLMTRWAKEVSPKNAHPEYPRPQLVRKEWQNLNGLWDYAIRPKDEIRPATFDGKILVPFPIESALSGVMKQVVEQSRLWYRRTFVVPKRWSKKRILLHFGAVDWEAVVFVNGKEVGVHRGGYDSFSFDITEALKPSGEQEIVVSVWDPTDGGPQPRGKQVRKPGGIWYTPTSGIWQTVWLEPVNAITIDALKTIPDVDQGRVKIEADVTSAPFSNMPEGATKFRVEVLDGDKRVGAIEEQASLTGKQRAVRVRSQVPLPNAKLWSPDSPFLYGLRLTLLDGGKKLDQVESYFGMRKISMARDGQGRLRMQLNHTNYFQLGPLDQGFWPDGLYTAPTDDALRYDIEMLKKLGFNMARKHVKVEPDRWYYWCDKLGLLVWQDMPSGDKTAEWRGPSGVDGREMTRTAESAAIYERELRALIDGRYNHPSIVVWVPFNEGWGQFDTVRILNLAKQLDPTRLVDGASGGNHFPAGDILDHHQYPGPGAPRGVTDRAMVLGEFGGLGLPVKGRTWQEEKNWGYRSYNNSGELTDAYLGLIRKLRPVIEESGLSAAIYTQTSDVEVEVNGLMTYDRALVKMDEAAIAAANKSVYTPIPPRRTEGSRLVPPATPLVACDPYFSIWSPGDKLTDEDTVHWTGRPHRLTSLVRIDGKVYRLMGASPATAPALEQKSLSVQPTRTVCGFAGAGVALTLTFMTAALPEDIEVLSRPVTYLTYEVRSTDGKSHELAIYFDASPEIAVNEPRQQVEWTSENAADLRVLKVGSKDQPVLAKKGDDLRIDWGYLYLAAPRAQYPSSAIVPSVPARADFAAKGALASSYDLKAPVVEAGSAPFGSFIFDLGKVASQPVSRWLMLAYDDLYSIQYMRKNLRPYWRRNGWEAADLLKAAARDYESLKQRCAAFDEELMSDLTRAGGEPYAKLAALAYRQCFAAGTFVADDNGQPLQFCKENHSNGCIGTSDVFYPMAPQFLLFGPSLAKSFLVPFMNYAASERWKFPFAPHDLGTYPKANGQVYGGGERTEENQMPVEESGNLLILMAAVAQMEGNADFAGLYWRQLEQWADYLKAKGFDPENQLCTDDFAGHLAHNVNLSAKAICALGAFAKLCEARGDKARAGEYSQLARGFARRWVKEADDGDHFRLAFDRPGTWSQKYNLIWDRILGLNLFPAEVARREMDYYRKSQNRFGLPLDNRQTYTKLDWILWTATLTQDRADFESLVEPVFRFLNETPDRSPMTDWYQTKTAKKVGFTARPVVGGVFAQMLYDQAVWRKYASRDKTRAANWAPFPKPPVMKIVTSTAREDANIEWRYITQKPADDWSKPEFDAAAWKKGNAGFGTRGTPGAVVRTEWNTPDIWLRREFSLLQGQQDSLQLWIHHDEDAEIYVNGAPSATVHGYTTDYEEVPLNAMGRDALKPGNNVLAVHCHQTGGGQYIDVGLVNIEPAQR
jgi:hypothetical protein